MDMLARTYGKLPSEVLNDGDTFDMLVFDVSNSYTQYQQNKQKGKAPKTGDFNKDQLSELSKKYYGKDIV
jgi:hypothetical protein